jgi:hypothetical protein
MNAFDIATRLFAHYDRQIAAIRSVGTLTSSEKRRVEKLTREANKVAERIRQLETCTAAKGLDL